MKEKQKLLLSTTICLIASAVALTSFTFAWFTQDHAMNNVITLTSGNTEAKVEAHIYERLFPTSGGTAERGYFVDSTSTLNMTQYANTAGNINVRFSSDMMLDYDLLNAYANENAVSAIALPSFYVELRVIKPSSYGYLSLKLVYQSIPSALGTELDLSSVYPFAYRTLTVNNSLTTPLVSALPTQIGTLEAKTGTPFFNTSAARAAGVTLFDASDLTGAPISSTTGLAPQRFIPGFSPKVSGHNVFATSVMLQIYLDPMTVFKFIREHTNVMNTSMRLGIEFLINAQYSNNPIQA